MLQYAVEALRVAQLTHHGAAARVSLVIADALHYAGRFDLACPWYAAVREHALVEGDDAMISAMLHNIAAFRANEVRLADAFGTANSADAKRALLEAESTSNYDLGIGTLSMAFLIPLMKAQLLAIEGRFEEALEIFNDMLEQESPENLERRKGLLLRRSRMVPSADGQNRTGTHGRRISARTRGYLQIPMTKPQCMRVLQKCSSYRAGRKRRQPTRSYRFFSETRS
jgi:hypothetical protein